MRKLLVLMLVLGMASLASATLMGTVDWTVEGGQLIGTGTAEGVVDMCLALDVPNYGNPQAVITLDPTTDGPNTDGVMDIAGNAAKINAYSGMWRVQASDESTDETTWTQEVGVWFRFDIQDSTETIEVWSSSWVSLGTIPLPEPMSMVLLGLGGLFLRRRK